MQITFKPDAENIRVKIKEGYNGHCLFCSYNPWTDRVPLGILIWRWLVIKEQNPECHSWGSNRQKHMFLYGGGGKLRQLCIKWYKITI